MIKENIKLYERDENGIKHFILLSVFIFVALFQFMVIPTANRLFDQVVGTYLVFFLSASVLGIGLLSSTSTKKYEWDGKNLYQTKEQEKESNKEDEQLVVVKNAKA